MTFGPVPTAGLKAPPEIGPPAKARQIVQTDRQPVERIALGLLRAGHVEHREGEGEGEERFHQERGRDADTLAGATATVLPSTRQAIHAAAVAPSSCEMT